MLFQGKAPVAAAANALFLRNVLREWAVWYLNFYDGKTNGMFSTNVILFEPGAK